MPLLICCLPAQANTITAASCSQTDVQNAINSASEGDTVVVPGGTCSWGGSVTIPNSVGLTIYGGGNTTITSGTIFIQQGLTETRVTGFTFQGTGNCEAGNAVDTNGSPSSFAARIDHNTFNPVGGGTAICTNGNAPVLIDNNTFNIPSNAGAIEVIHNVGLGFSNGQSGWSVNVTPGGPGMVFVEDNTVLFPVNGNFSGASFLQSYAGAQTVVRHNQIHNMQIDQHGSVPVTTYPWVRWWEIYDNEFVNDSGAEQCCYIVVRGGSGVVWGNTHSGTNSVTGIIQLDEEAGGSYPALDQVGRGINQALSPAYLWGNDAALVVTSVAANVQLNRDYYVSATQPASMSWQEKSGDTPSTTYNYVPYTYPHPLQGSQNAPSPPTGLTAVAH
ncbi:MAG: hypothetical protein WB997_08900 [Candidatus Acidiferrales bacterium]